ncbi:MAG: alpha/beta hydrolase family protein [Desulfobaccales bacterium]
MKSKAARVLLLPVILLLVSASITWSQGAGAARPIDYALNDGTRLTGYLSLPPDYQPGKKYPAILLIHGGRGDGKELLSRADGFLKIRPVQEHLCRRYVVLAAAYHSDYLGGPLEIESMAAALKALAGLPQVDRARLAALGVSHGGYLALMCAGHPRIPVKIKAAVSISGVVDVAAFLQQRYRPSLWGRLAPGGQPPELAASPAVRALGWPPDKDAGTRGNYDRLSVLTYVGSFQAPVLAIHGTQDNLVPVSQARSLKEALEQRQKVFEYLEVPTGRIGGHFIIVTSKAVWEKVDAFLKRYL